MAHGTAASLTAERDPSAEELRARVSARIRLLAATTSELRTEVNDRVRAMKDLKGQARRHPLWLVGLAGGAGLVAASLLGRRRGRNARLAALLAGLLVRLAARGLAPRDAGEREPERRWRPTPRH